MVTPNKREPNKHSVIVLVRRETSLKERKREEERGREMERMIERVDEGEEWSEGM